VNNIETLGFNFLKTLNSVMNSLFYWLEWNPNESIFVCVWFRCYETESQWIQNPSVFNVIQWDPNELLELHPNEFNVFLKGIPVDSMFFYGILMNYWNGIQMNSILLDLTELLEWHPNDFFLKNWIPVFPMLFTGISLNYWNGILIFSIFNVIQCDPTNFFEAASKPH